MKRILTICFLVLSIAIATHADSPVVKISGGGYLTADSVYFLGWGMVVQSDTAKPNVSQIWADSVWEIVHLMIDTTTAHIPVADSALAITHQAIKPWHLDSTSANFVFDGAFHVTGAQADSEYLTHGGAAAAYATKGMLTDTSWALRADIGDTARAADKLHSHIASIPIENIDDTYDRILFKLPYAITIDSVFGLCAAGTNVVGALDEYDYAGTSITAAVDADWTITTSQYVDGSFTNAGLDAGDWLGWHTTSVSGTVTHFTLTVWFHEN